MSKFSRMVRWNFGTFQVVSALLTAEISEAELKIHEIQISSINNSTSFTVGKIVN